MDIYITIFELIDTRSFTSMWFWIVLAVFWSTMSHFVLGVPYDLVQRAARTGAGPMQEVEDLARVNTSRILYISGAVGLTLTAIASFLLSSLALLGFFYRVEFCQALFLLAFPFMLVSMISQRTARIVRAENLAGRALLRRLRKQRLMTQLIGVVSIFVTAFWGIFQVMSTSILGG